MLVPCGVPDIQGDETVTLCSLQELTLWGGGKLSGETENKSRQERILTSRARVSESERRERERERERETETERVSVCVCVCAPARAYDR